MKAAQLKEQQAVCKAQYRDNPQSAIQTLSAQAILDPDNLACQIVRPEFLSPAGLHPSGGGDGSFACPVEIMLAGLVGCAGVTNSMKVGFTKGSITAEGDLDFRGTLAVDKQAPVGLTAIRLVFDLETDADQATIDKLIQLTHRYCVVHQTLDSPPPVSVITNLSSCQTS